MRFSARKLGCLAAACLLAGLLPASCRRGQGEQPAVEILVIDSFVLSEHGRTVRGIAEDWSLGTCPIQEFDVELPERDGYLKALQAAAEHIERQPKVRFLVNISLASPSPGQEEQQWLESMVRRGAIVLAAAGNDGREEPLYPAGYDGVLAVAAGRNGHRQPYSNYGRHIALTVATRDIRHTEEAVQLPRGLVVRQIIESGTSLSAPKLAGLLALVWAGDPGMPRDAVLAAMRSCCRPMRDPLYAGGSLGVGQLDDLCMVRRSRAGRERLLVLAAVLALWAAAFVALAWGRLSGAFFTLVAAALTAMFYAVLDLPWTLTWGVFVPVAVFPAVFGLYRWVAPLRGLRVRLWPGEGCAALAARLQRRLRKLGATTGRAAEAEDEAALPEEQLMLLVELLGLPGRGALCRCRWIGPFDGPPPPPRTVELPVRGAAGRAAAFIQQVARRPPEIHRMEDEDLLAGPA